MHCTIASTTPIRSKTIMHKTWNVRDQTKEELEVLLERKYKEIDNNYKILRKVSKIEDAKRLIDETWQIKSFTKNIELELMRREYANGIS